MKKTLIGIIENKLKKIKSRYSLHYGAVFFDIKIKDSGDIVVLEGMVLSRRQKKEAFLAAYDILKDIKIKNEIKVLSDPKEKLEIGWGIIKNSLVDIWGIFPGKKKIGNKDLAFYGERNQAIYGERNQAIYGERSRATQAIKGDIVRILAKKGNYYLVQTQDLAVGWAKKRQIANGKWQMAKQKWGKAKRAEKDELLKIKLTDKIRKKFIGFTQDYLYVPYVWGGTTELGIDCSGLTQKFYQDIFGILLPRNSRDQALCGKEIVLEKAQFGDLVFLREKTKKYAHIGIVIEKSSFYEIPQGGNPESLGIISQGKNLRGILILNARKEKGGTVIQSAEEILKDYNLISVRRLINLK